MVALNSGLASKGITGGLANSKNLASLDSCPRQTFASDERTLAAILDFAHTINFDTVRKIGLALPGAEQSTAYWAPALRVQGNLMACVPAHRSAEPGSLMVRVGFDDRAGLRRSAPS